MPGRLRAAAARTILAAVLVLASCTGETPGTPTPTRTSTTPPVVTTPPVGPITSSPIAPTTAAPIGPTAEPADIQPTIPCSEDAATQLVGLSDDPDGRPGGVGGGEREGFDKGEPPRVPDDPDATVFEAPPLADPMTAGPGGVGPRIRPTAFLTSESTIVTNSTPPEPHVAMDGSNVLLTWNRHAAVSTDGGRTFFGMDPETFVGTEEFCCDQLAHHIPGRNLWVWVMQTESGHPPRPNHIRVAVTHGGRPFSSPVSYTYWEWSPQAGDFPAGTWLDRPKVGTTNDHLFLAVNAYLWISDERLEAGGSNRPQGSLVIRMPLDELVAGDTLESTCFTTRYQAVPVTVAAGTMYIADHHQTSSLLLWRWPDVWPSPDYRLVTDVDEAGNTVDYINDGYSCRRNGIRATDWCAGKSDDRIQTGWVAGGRIGFAWNAAQHGTPDTPYPYVYSVFIDEGSLTVVDHWPLKVNAGALQYPMFATNSRGDIGGVLMFGGGEGPIAGAPAPEDRRGYPWCLGVIRDAATGETSTMWAERVNQSSVDPRPRTDLGIDLPRIGDYVGAWASPIDQTWGASCMSYTERGAQIHFYRFGKPEDIPGT